MELHQIDSVSFCVTFTPLQSPPVERKNTAEPRENNYECYSESIIVIIVAFFS